MVELAQRVENTMNSYLDTGHRVWRTAAVASRRWRQHVPTKQLIAMTSQLALMLETGNTIFESLTALSRQTEATKMGPVLENVAASVESGRTFTESLTDHPEAFPRLFVSSVRAGDASGRLIEVFKRIELHLTKRVHLRESIRTALTYPAILTVLLMAVVTFAVLFVLPRFAAIFENVGVALPLPARMLMAVATASRQYWYLIPTGVVLIVIGVAVLFYSSRGLRFVDKILLGTPVVGGLWRGINTSSLTRTLGMMLGSGVGLVESLEVARDSVGSPSFRRLVDSIMRSVVQGESFSAPFGDGRLLSPVDRQMAQTGEKTGSLPTVMTRLADYHDEQVDVKLKRLTSIMEPMFIAVMGLFVGFIALAVLLPLFKMASALKMQA